MNNHNQNYISEQKTERNGYSKLKMKNYHKHCKDYYKNQQQKLIQNQSSRQQRYQAKNKSNSSEEQSQNKYSSNMKDSTKSQQNNTQEQNSSSDNNNKEQSNKSRVRQYTESQIIIKNIPKNYCSAIMKYINQLNDDETLTKLLNKYDINIQDFKHFSKRIAQSPKVKTLITCLGHNITKKVTQKSQTISKIMRIIIYKFLIEEGNAYFFSNQKLKFKEELRQVRRIFIQMVQEPEKFNKTQKIEPNYYKTYDKYYKNTEFNIIPLIEQMELKKQEEKEKQILQQTENSNIEKNIKNNEIQLNKNNQESILGNQNQYLKGDNNFQLNVNYYNNQSDILQQNNNNYDINNDMNDDQQNNSNDDDQLNKYNQNNQLLHLKENSNYDYGQEQNNLIIKFNQQEQKNSNDDLKQNSDTTQNQQNNQQQEYNNKSDSTQQGNNF